MILLHITESTLSDDFTSYTYFPVFAFKPTVRVHANIFKAQSHIQRDDCRKLYFQMLCSAFKERRTKILKKRLG